MKESDSEASKDSRVVVEWGEEDDDGPATAVDIPGNQDNFVVGAQVVNESAESQDKIVVSVLTYYVLHSPEYDILFKVWHLQ